MFAHCAAMSHAISEAAQKYGGDLIHLTCNEIVTTSFMSLGIGRGRSLQKFYFSLSLQSSFQNPLFISHLTMKIFLSGTADAKAMVIHDTDQFG